MSAGQQQGYLHVNYRKEFGGAGHRLIMFPSAFVATGSGAGFRSAWCTSGAVWLAGCGTFVVAYGNVDNSLTLFFAMSGSGAFSVADF